MAGSSFFLFFSIFFQNHFLFSSLLNHIYSMKTIRNLIIFLILTGSLCPKLFSAEPFHLALYADSEKTLGTKLSLPFFEFRFNTRMPKESFGVSFSTKKFSIVPLTMKIGNLSEGGSISALKNPMLSAGSSPFSSGITSVTGLSANLPDYTSFSKPAGIFVQAELPFPVIVNCFATEDLHEPVVSFLTFSSFFNKRLTFRLSSTAGSFEYKSNGTSSWFLRAPYYQSGSHLSFINQFSMDFNPKSKSQRIPSILFNFTAAFYESPFGGLPFNLRTDIKLSAKHTEVFASAFYNPVDGIITSSQKSLPSCIQLKGGLSAKTILGMSFSSPFFLKSGFNVYSQINLMENEHPLKINAGIQLANAANVLSFSASLNLNLITSVQNQSLIQSEISSISFQIKDSFYLKHINAGAALSASFSPEKSENFSAKYKIAVNAGNTHSQKLNGNASFSINTRGNEVSSKNLDASLTAKLQFRWLSVTGKISCKIDFNDL